MSLEYGVLRATDFNNLSEEFASQNEVRLLSDSNPEFTTELTTVCSIHTAPHFIFTSIIIAHFAVQLHAAQLCHCCRLWF